MTRVGFVIAAPGTSWTGGVNYYANLLRALADQPDRRIETVAFVSPDADDTYVARFPADRIVRTAMFLPRAPLRLVGRALERTIGRNLVVERFLQQHGIDLLSHAEPLGKRSRFRTLGWIPDFQELHLPAFFSAEEIAIRAASHRLYAERSTRLVLSSENARRDLIALFPDVADRTGVLRFVAGGGLDPPGDGAAIRAKYALPNPYFHLPNQLWAHKNHKIVVAALAILKARGVDMTVISTGATEDYRNPGFHAEFVAAVAAAGVADRFRIAGLVPFADVGALLRHATAVINPSLFEGWSTTVEEAKSLGKRIVLSDIPVHREQAPARGVYFPPHDAEALADALTAMLATHDPAAERAAADAADVALPGRIRDFARTYEAIALNAASAPRR